MMKKLKDKKGFTLAELLIVIAIIAVLVGIAIPVFSSQLTKAKFTTELANARATYAEKVTAAMMDDDYTETGVVSVDLKDIADAAPHCTVEHASNKITVKWGSAHEGEFPVDPQVTINPIPVP